MNTSAIGMNWQFGNKIHFFRNTPDNTVIISTNQTGVATQGSDMADSLYHIGISDVKLHFGFIGNTTASGTGKCFGFGSGDVQYTVFKVSGFGAADLFGDCVDTLTPPQTVTAYCRNTLSVKLSCGVNAFRKSHAVLHIGEIGDCGYPILGNICGFAAGQLPGYRPCPFRFILGEGFTLAKHILKYPGKALCGGSWPRRSRRWSRRRGAGS